MRDCVITLVNEEWIRDELGIGRKTENNKTIFAKVSSVTQSEWFEGGRNGLNPQLEFTVFSHEYSNEEIVEYNGVRYTVYRTYKPSDDVLELYVQLKKGNA